VFGSRAKGTHAAHSDVDLAVWGNLSPLEAQTIAAELDDLPLPFSYDVQVFDSVKSSALRDHIERVGISIYPGQSVEVIEACYQELKEGRSNFWDATSKMSSEDLRGVMVFALRESDGSYRKAADLLHIEQKEYRPFMDLLRKRNALVDCRPFQKLVPHR
jgi:predicted nucleotidyltransferase